MKGEYQGSPQPLKRLYDLPTEHQLRHGRNGFQWTSSPERLTEFEEPIRGEGWIKYPIKGRKIPEAVLPREGIPDDPIEAVEGNGRHENL